MHDITKEFIKATEEATERFDKKQDVYSHHNIAETGEIGVITRIGDLLSEIKRYYAISPEKRNELNLSDEKIYKHFLDIGIYGLIGLIIRKGNWPT